MFYEAARSEIWFARSPRSASTPADRSKRAPQLSPGAALPALCLLVSGRFGDPVHRRPVLVYGTGVFDNGCPERAWIELLDSSLKRAIFKDDACKMMWSSLKRMVFEDE